MKKLHFQSFLAIVISVLGALTATAQNTSATQYYVNAYPLNPSAKDSVYVAYTYISNDGCPDCYLVIDSVVSNRIYVNKKAIVSDRACTQVISKFSSTINLGIILKNTQIYFEGKLLSTITPQCVMDKTGIVVTGTNECAGKLFIQEISPLAVIQLYAFENSVNKNDGSTSTSLKAGDKVKFAGYLNKNDSTNRLCNIVGYATCCEKIPDTSDCVMDRKGKIIESKDNSSIVNDLSTGEIFEIKNKKLITGSIIIFKGTIIQCITTPCLNIVDCYQVVSVPPTPCIMDKTGIVVTGKDIFAGRLFIQEISPINSYIPIYAIPVATTANLPQLKEGEKVKFGGYLQKNDSAASAIYPMKIVGIATCWTIIPDTTVCVMNRKGEIIKLTDNSSIVRDFSNGEIFEIKGVKLTIGTTILFKGTIIQCITTPCYNIVDCYQITNVPPAPCIIDKMGVVVQGVGGCTGHLFIELISPAAIALKQLYTFKNNTLSPDGSALPILKPGDKVQFGGYLVTNDNNTVQLCNVIGVATCWNIISDSTSCVMNRKGQITELTDHSSILKDISTGEKFEITGVKLNVGTTIIFKGTIIKCVTAPCYNIVDCYQIISVPPTPCVMDKMGIVVQGIDGCTGRIFIQEMNESTNYPQLYILQNYIASNSTGTTISKLQVGDKVKFGGYLTTNDSTKSILCNTVGVATCWELIPSENTYQLSGKVMAGTDLMKSGLAVLFRKGEGKAIASNTITDGTFTFNNMPSAAYTIYVIPDISIYKNYLPTFYVNKFLYDYADYIKLSKNINDVVVYLRNLNMPMGAGRIYGNIYYEKEQLKDSILAAKGSLSSITSTNTTAENVTVVLFDNTNQPTYWTITDAVGNYSFDNLSLSSYNIISETASAKAEATVNLSTTNTTANADLILKSPQEMTDTKQLNDIVVGFYPNPVENQLIISVKENEKLNIFSTVSQLIFNQSLITGVNVLDVSALQRGIYLAKIGNRTIRMFKK